MEFLYKIPSLVVVPLHVSLWLLCAISQVVMIFNRKPGVRLFQARLLYNPFLMQFRGRYYLTDRGLFWRNLSWASGAIFALMVWAGTRILD
jgi:hypothetical protein